jgi:hypothetical protein
MHKTSGHSASGTKLSAVQFQVENAIKRSAAGKKLFAALLQEKNFFHRSVLN